MAVIAKTDNLAKNHTTLRILLALILIVTTFFGCADKAPLLQINATAKVTDGFAIHNLIKTGVYTPLTDSVQLAKYLGPAETADAMQNLQTKTYNFYKDLGTMDGFLVRALLLTQNKNGKECYTYQLRSYDNAGKPVDMFEFAVWDGADNRYCSGMLSREWIINRTCDTTTEVWQLMNSGRFVASSFHK